MQEIIVVDNASTDGTAKVPAEKFPEVTVLRMPENVGADGASRMSPSVASITVAYNAAGLLPRQIDALLRQTRPLQEIVVVDNASSDGTNAMLAERYPQVTVLRMPDNLGQAGGWSAGLSYAALRKRYDWIWTFDNDSVPGPQALETLFKGMESVGDTAGTVGMLAGVPAHTGTGAAYLPFLWRDGFVKPSAEQIQQPVWFADMVIASGCLIRRDVVERVGLPRADFFIDFCDFEYCLRARSHGYKVAVVNSSKVGHEIGNSRRVRVLGYFHLWMEHTPWREYYISRNIVYATWWLYPNSRAKRFVIGHLIRHAGGILLFSSGKIACLTRLAQGFWDGYRGRLGIRFRPDLP